MPDKYSPNDLFHLQEDVVNGKLKMADLPDSTAGDLQRYWEDNPASYANDPMMSNLDQARLGQMSKERSAKAAADLPFFLKPIEWVGSKIYWLYSHTTSPLVSMAAMGLHDVLYGQQRDYKGAPAIESWQDAWDAARNTSPGQAIWMLGLNDKELKDRGISTDQITQDSKKVLAGTYHDKPTEADPFGNKTPKEEYFGSGGAKYATGAADLAVSWWGDPLVLTGRFAGITRAAALLKPTERAVARAGGDFDKLAATPTFNKMVDTVMKYKAADNETAPLRLRRDMPTIRKSADGDLLARLLGRAKDEEEVGQVLRISFGDYKGYLGLEAKNIGLAAEVRMGLQKVTALDARYHGLSPTSQESAAGQRIKSYLENETKNISKMNQETRFIDEKLDAFRSIDNMNFNRVTTPIGMKIRGSSLAQGQKISRDGMTRIQAFPAMVYNSTVAWPIRAIRSYNDIKPSYHIDVHGENSYLEVQEALKETKILSREDREKMVSSYIKATPNERGRDLIAMENDIVHKVAEKYGVDPAVAKDVYTDFAARRQSGQQAAAGRTYGSGTMPDPANPGQTIRVAEIDSDGGRLISTPLFDTQLANSHVMMDFGNFEKIIARHGKKFEALKNTWGIRGQAWYQANHVADTLGSYWKFAQLFRLGYAPRALSDDFLGQVARFGAISMVGRTGRGATNMATRFTRGRWAADEVATAQEKAALLETHISELGARQSQLKVDMAAAKARGDDWTTIRDENIDVADQLEAAKADHLDATNVFEKTARKDIKVGRQVFDAPFGGQQGKLFEDLSSGKRNLSNLMGREADWYLKRMRRVDWENITPGSHGVEKHAGAWERLINDQIGKSSIGRQVLAGKSEGELVRWMHGTPEGMKYRADIGLKNISDAELAQRVKAQVDYVMDPTIPGMAAIRQSALAGRLDMETLKEAVPAANRPMVNAETFKYAEGTSTVSQLVDKTITGYYNLANQLPATKLLRNPLFAQMYKHHLQSDVKVLESQGVTRMDEAMRMRLETAARKKALADVKSFTFNMDHETKMAYNMRHFGAFFGAQQESWNRWARIIADKPQTLPHIAQVYGAPARVGMVTDQDGNPIDGAGYVRDPVTGERRLTKYADRKILFQIPEYLGGKKLNRFLGLDEDAKLTVPMSSVNIVLNHGDGALPVGAGPFVQMSINHYAKESPDVADWAQQMGVLPFGPQDSVLNFINPNTGKRLGDSMDDMGATRQRALLYMMQVEHYKYENGLRDTEPTWKELDARAKKWSIFKTIMAFSLPVSMNAQDPYQFFRDEYNRMQKIDPARADEAFHDKYGDSLFSFSASLSKNNTGLRPTKESVQMSKYYQDLIGKMGPEYAGLVVGDEGDGAFSQGAYYYQKTHAAAAGSSTTQRSTMSAREAWAENQKGLGRVQYGQVMDGINSELYGRGLMTFNDAGAEDLKAQKQSLVHVLGSPTLYDGSENPYYNKAWSEEFNSFDTNKYDRTAKDLRMAVEDPELWSKAYDPETKTVGIRSDIFSLRSYLDQRINMQVQLASRKREGGSNDILAQSNEDLKDSFDLFTRMLIEQDTKFGRLHSRWFSTDMGFNLDTEYTPAQQTALRSSTETLTEDAAGKSAAGQSLGVDLFG